MTTAEVLASVAGATLLVALGALLGVSFDSWVAGWRQARPPQPVVELEPPEREPSYSMYAEIAAARGRRARGEITVSECEELCRAARRRA